MLWGSGPLSSRSTVSSSFASSSHDDVAYERVTYRIGRDTFTINARYSVMEVVGRGGFGVVCSARDLATGEVVAVKQIRGALESVIRARAAAREVEVLRHVRGCDNVLHIYDAAVDGTDVYIVTRLYDFDMKRLIASPCSISMEAVAHFAMQLLRAVKYVHSAGVLHRDIKPSNILIGGEFHLVLADFGLARGGVDHDIAKTDLVVTRYYRSPELLMNTPLYGTEVDMWSLGCVVAELVRRRPMFRGSTDVKQLSAIFQKLGTPPPEMLATMASRDMMVVVSSWPRFPGSTMRELFPSSPPEFVDFVRRLLEMDPSRRMGVDDALTHPFVMDFRRVDESACVSRFDDHRFLESLRSIDRLRDVILDRSGSEGALSVPLTSSSAVGSGGGNATADEAVTDTEAVTGSPEEARRSSAASQLIRFVRKAVKPRASVAGK